MKAPDKIYVGIDHSQEERQEYLDYRGINTVFVVEPKLLDNWNQERLTNEDIEYVRKDTLVDWLKKEIDNYWADSESKMGIYPYAMETVIKKINSL